VRRRTARGEAALGLERGGERLGREVGGDLGVARRARVVTQDRVDMPTVEDRETVRASSRRQLVVTAASESQAPTLHS
jgi:hypothetical protein